MRPGLFVGATVAVLVVGCTQQKLSPDITRLQNQILQAQRELAALENKLKDSGEDRGLQQYLSEERELEKSRLGRLLQNWQVLVPGRQPPNLSPTGEGNESAHH